MEQRIVIRNIKLPYDADESEAIELAKKRVRAAHLTVADNSARVQKRSTDARRSRANPDGKPHFIYSISLSVNGKLSSERLARLDAAMLYDDEPEIVLGSEKLASRPIVVGFGPCGMFAALMLAENGYAPIVIERGADANERRAAVDRFYKSGVLESSNIQFGAGGAGTFSDGKLVTRINDPKCSYVLKRLYMLGAPEEILYNAKPHVGTDRLLEVVKNAAGRIEELGGEIRYNTKLEDIRVSGSRISQAILSDGTTLECSALILACGHSARDTYDMLEKRGIAIAAKPFSVGVRVEHLQSSVDKSLYGKYAGDSRLPVGEYALSHREGERAVYTFCMCPGGEVVAAASEQGGVVTNGMSNFARSGRNANAAVAVSIMPEDVGSGWRDSVEFQRKLERAAYAAGGGGFKAPAECVGDFLAGKTGMLSSPTTVIPTYMGANVTMYPLDKLFPSYVNDMLRRGIDVFSHKMKCFGESTAVLTGVETRTSAPCRILRTERMTSLDHDGLYPCGEGAGYAGGITSAAVDGINTALAVMERYAPLA